MPRAVHDPQRRGILIPAQELVGTPFKPGDRFSVRKGKQAFFTLKLLLDPNGPIVFDRQGIFVERTRRVDILLGGIFDEFEVDLSGADSGVLCLAPTGETLPALGGS
jgi:hypothetical protein